MTADMPEAVGNQPDACLLPRRGQVLELLVFLLLVVPSMVLSLFVVGQGGVGFPLTATIVISHDLGLLGLVLFFLWRNREPWASIGWVSRNVGVDVGFGIVLFVPFFFGTAALESVLQQLGLSSPPMPSYLQARNMTQGILGALLVVVVALAEESIFRGYLLLRLTTATRSTVAAVLISSAIFSIGHGYEGSVGLVTVGAMGAVFAIIYLWRGSLVAPIVMHFLQDFIGIVVVPFLGLK